MQFFFFKKIFDKELKINYNFAVLLVSFLILNEIQFLL